jgi:hypothetical protein
MDKLCRQKKKDRSSAKDRLPENTVIAQPIGERLHLK